MSEKVMLTWDELMAKGQITVYVTPGNITKDFTCTKCGGHYVCTEDFKEHNCIPRNTSKGKLTTQDLDELPWKLFKKRDGAWIFSNQAPYLQTAIINGHTTFGAYRYWISDNGKFIGRSLIND
ncbi:hypothetical protein GH146_01750 [archaeon]|nr:hypothetical protein [archaeon]